MGRTIYYNGVVYNVGNKIADGFITAGDVYTFVGSNEELMKRRRPKDRLVDLEGKFVCSGLTNGTIDLIKLGEQLVFLDLSSCTSTGMVLDKLVEYIGLNNRRVIIGVNLDTSKFVGVGSKITKKDLDNISVVHCICLVSVDGSIIVNNKLRKVYGYGKTNSELKSILFSYSERQLETFIRAASMVLYRNGYTSTICTGLSTTGKDYSYNLFKAIPNLKYRGKLPLRCYINLPLKDFLYLTRVDKEISTYKNTQGGIQFNAMLVKVDGKIEDKETMRIKNYAMQPDNFGKYLIDSRELDKIINQCSEYRTPLLIECNGSVSLDYVLGKLKNKDGSIKPLALGSGVIGCYICNEEQAKLLKEYNLAYFTDLSEFNKARVYSKTLSKEELVDFCKFKTFRDCAHATVFGSTGIKTLNPFYRMKQVVTRVVKKSEYNLDEALTTQEVLDTFISGSTKLTKDTYLLNGIKKNMLANFIILNNNPLRMEVEDLDKIKVLKTFINGDLVYERKE